MSVRETKQMTNTVAANNFPMKKYRISYRTARFFFNLETVMVGG